MTAGLLRERVAFDAETLAPDGYGGQARAWAEVHECAAAFKYQRGQEAVEAGGLTGTATFKVKVRACAATKALTASHRMRDVRRGVSYNLREVDAVTDPAFVWVVAENGVAI
ncbi:phage head closure protein [Sedimentimonas flavescens]|uniref:Phage head closure protein n=1 Tax=Sedimentimonas flavescens TaxID=2851012 RepID=A0ABT2ZWC3_9RHOB|nr:phage head closure protein [Sedimentimonas flavescens]MCV2877605.1 phage head closure protein [Sedimentimonas flavescens]